MGIRYLIRGIYIFFDFAKVKVLVKDAQVLANLLVPKETCVGTPTAIIAGKLISPPPPAIESTAAAIKPATQINK
jgi:hypothetical protein